MNNADKILALENEIAIKLEAYRAGVDHKHPDYKEENEWLFKQIDAHNKEVADLRSQIQALHLEGAIISEKIKPYMIGDLVGMKRVIAVDKEETGLNKEKNMTYKFTNRYDYEVGCSIKVEVMGEVKSQGVFTRGATPEEAVQNWNAGNYQYR